MPSAEPGLADVLELIPAYVDEVVLQTVRDTHDAWTTRAYGAVNTATHGAAAGAEQLHRDISGAVFGSLRLGLRAGSVATSVLGGLSRGRGLTGRRAATVHSALNGLLGDRFELEQSRLSIAMSVRRDGRDVLLDDSSLRAAFPEATDRVVVFLHGLGEHDEHWSRQRDRRGSTYAETLAAQGWTPVMLRMNTGLSLRENGAALAGLLQDLYDAWPSRPRRIALVGHSMGGLIARAGCAVATANATAGATTQPWQGALSDVITLGTPHLGADLARAVGFGSQHLARLPETAAFGRLLDVRSVGIVDLGLGLRELEAHPGVRHRLVSGSLPGRWGVLFGDAMVRRGSATGRDRRSDLFPDAEVLHLEGVGHLDLLNHRDVDLALSRWLADPWDDGRA
ncbi:esterase/lipase family protein [Nocardioides sp.]|uniref:esterase/lipase family protein n=1 Tax=Nocardioides sp. TaxID=35761 RepID=UPI003D12A0EE